MHVNSQLLFLQRMKVEVQDTLAKSRDHSCSRVMLNNYFSTEQYLMASSFSSLTALTELNIIDIFMKPRWIPPHQCLFDRCPFSLVWGRCMRVTVWPCIYCATFPLFFRAKKNTSNPPHILYHYTACPKVISHKGILEYKLASNNLSLGPCLARRVASVHDVFGFHHC